MQSQNHAIWKGNRSYQHFQIQIHQLPEIFPLKSPNFHIQSAQPLNFDWLKMANEGHAQIPPQSTLKQEQKFKNSKNNEILSSKLRQNADLKQLAEQNEFLKSQLFNVKKMFEQQKTKYNELKNLYKEGQSMFELIEQRRIFVQKQNKELKSILENLYKELHQRNEENQSQFSEKGEKNQTRRIKIGNKKIPVIKVNVPAETFIKKEHGISISSVNSENQQILLLKEQINGLSLRLKRLTEENSNLKRELNSAKSKMQDDSKLSRQQQQMLCPGPKFDSNLYKPLQSELNQSLSHPNYFEKTKPFSQYQNKGSNPNSTKIQGQFYQGTNLHYLEKYTKNQFQREAASNKVKDLPTSETDMKSNDKKLSQFKTIESRIDRQSMQNSRIAQLQRRIDEMKLNYENLHQTTEKLSLENSTYQQKILSQQFELSRLYQILQNKNAELGEIYSAIKYSKKQSQLSASKKKSVDTILASTPEKPNQA